MSIYPESPADFSFSGIRSLDGQKFLSAIGLEGARYTRIGGVPERGPEKRFLTKSLWLNNNKLKSTKNIDELVNEALEYPKELGWLDFSFNYITEIHESLLQFPNLKILYFHGNCINDLNEVFKLRPLKELRSVTFHGNPIANHPRYRNYVVSVLPQIVNLDFTPITQTEKQFAMPPEVVRKLKEEKLKVEAAKKKPPEQPANK
ncbi:leucine-rich repeat-containing protein 51-like isoform X2 [Anthonomus grandis grandis]|uniref:leucine-rich repeat-containing protein 51-like isoform X2 n=1 Tax=Anthonomus grandis grandis TaxID=2921223 RepID=UPI00216625FD|nr:leucine-rich repeat-containing protein 51-like isoform X2 [Anthonomus grandis grandis]